MLREADVSTLKVGAIQLSPEETATTKLQL